MAIKKKDLEEFRQRLIDLRKHITEMLQGKTAEVKEPDKPRGYSQHQADEGTDDFGKTISLEVTNKEFVILKQIDRALEKTDDGTYGICDVSGEEIPRARLDAVPYATMTVQAQEKLERGRVS